MTMAVSHVVDFNLIVPSIVTIQASTHISQKHLPLIGPFFRLAAFVGFTTFFVNRFIFLSQAF